MNKQKIDLIRQALTASESSIKLARQLLTDLEKEGGKNRPLQKEIPGIGGIFDGQNMTTETGEKYPVPENYASKSIIVVGDTLKLMEEGGEKRFKQTEHVKRHKTTGILAKKDGKWTAVTSEGSYKVLPAAVAHFEGDIGDEVMVQLPANNLQVPWAALEKVIKKASVVETPEEPAAEKKEPAKREEKKEAPPVVAPPPTPAKPVTASSGDEEKSEKQPPAQEPKPAKKEEKEAKPAPESSQKEEPEPATVKEAQNNQPQEEELT